MKTIELWLDDERNPDDPIIQEKFGAHSGMVWVKTAESAVYYLSNTNVTHISFDHDLGSEENGTGYDVAKWIESHAFEGSIGKVTWTVHSMNIIGVQNIIDAMRNADRFWHENMLRL